jgi:hypothetical protein
MRRRTKIARGAALATRGNGASMRRANGHQRIGTAPAFPLQ